MASGNWLQRNAAIVVTVALAVGALLAVFDVLSSELLRPLPYPHPDRLVAVRENIRGFRAMSVALADVSNWSQAHIFAAIASYRTLHFALAGAGSTIEVAAPAVSASLFPLLGGRIVRGRGFDAAENRPGGRPAAILSHRLWRSRFEGVPGAVGKVIRLDGHPFTVVGVAARGFAFPRGSGLWVSLAAFPASSASGHVGFTALARLRRRQSMAGARAAVDTELRHASGHGASSETAAITPYLQYIAGGAGAALWAALAAVGLVLLVACLNTAMLLLARAESRRAELAVRAVLGAGPSRLRWLVIREALGLVSVGAAVGLAVAWMAVRLAGATLAAELPRRLAPWLDWRLAACLLAAIILTAAFASWWPAHRAAGSDPADALRAAGGGRAALGARGLGPKPLRIAPQGWLAATEVALAVPLAVAASPLLLSLRSLLQVNPGFRPAGVLTFQMSAGPGSAAGRPAALRALEHRFAALPGVRRAGMIFPPPLDGNVEFRFVPVGAGGAGKKVSPLAMVHVLDPGAFRALGINVLRGRAFTASDTKQSPAVIVDARLAARYWPGRDPIGQRIAFAGLGKPFPVVGVVRHVAVNSLTGKSALDRLPQIFLPASVLPTAPDFVLRAAPGLDAASLAPVAAAVVRKQIPGAALVDVETLRSLVAAALRPRRLATTLAAAFAALALCLAGLGIFAMLAHEVASRAGEIGIRMALGAAPAAAAVMIMRHGLRLAAVGCAAGLVFALAGGRALAAFLFRTPPLSAPAFAAALAGVFAVVLAATAIAARRAARLDPAALLRRT